MVSVYKFTDVLQVVVNEFVQLFAQISKLFVSLLAIGILSAFEHNIVFLTLLWNEWKIVIAVLLYAQIVFISVLGII